MRRAKKPSHTEPAASPDRRAQILASAMRRFLHFGVKKTAMREIADDCGLAVGTLYLSFANKDALIIGCADAFRAAHAAEARAILDLPDVDAEAKLRRYVLSRFHASRGLRSGAAEAAAELARHVLRLKPDDPAAEIRTFTAHLATILAAGKTSRAFPGVRDPEREARVLALALGVFFPIPGREPAEALGLPDLLNHLEWFLETWTRQ